VAEIRTRSGPGPTPPSSAVSVRGVLEISAIKATSWLDRAQIQISGRDEFPDRLANYCVAILDLRVFTLGRRSSRRPIPGDAPWFHFKKAALQATL
jgi:hypothetical protein